MPLTEQMREEYEHRFRTLVVREGRREDVERIITRIMRERDAYDDVSRETTVPWYVIATIHNLECGGRFNCHLHNGDPLTGRTKHVPAGRPEKGKPPFSWRDSAIDALQLQGFDVWQDWSVSGTLFKLESFNGFGYRTRGIPTPYLYAGSQFYERGKYVADRMFDPTAVSTQIGAATILQRMADQFLLPDLHESFTRPSDAKCEGVR